MESKILRQGDVMLIQISRMPRGLEEKDKVLALGEKTNHKHQFLSPQVQVFRDNNNQQFIQVKQKSQLLHEEHAVLDVPRGKYRVRLQREFDILQDQIRTVMD
jgi:hypothetical protein